MPIIPGLDHGAACAFDNLWKEARRWPFDDACSKLSALYELAKDNPALQPEMKLLKQLDDIHSRLCSNPVSEWLEKL